MRNRVLSAGIVVLAACAAPPRGPDPEGGGGGTPADAPPPTDPSPRIYGVTLDDVANLPTIVASLEQLPHRPTARIVFDEGQPPGAYADAVPAIHAVAGVMGELLDSSYVPTLSVDAYAARTDAYLAAFADLVDIWEIGNEINGEWVDATPGGTADVVAKIAAAYDRVHAAGKRTALTLYACDDADPAHAMLTWAAANVPERLRTGLDYVLVSFYEGDCGVAAPDWPLTFHRLRELFPSAALGFGEVGAVDSRGRRIADPAIAGPYLQRYYGLAIDEPGYIGGHFWWYYVEDMLPTPSAMFAILGDAMR